MSQTEGGKPPNCCGEVQIEDTKHQKFRGSPTVRNEEKWVKDLESFTRDWGLNLVTRPKLKKSGEYEEVFEESRHVMKTKPEKKRERAPAEEKLTDWDDWDVLRMPVDQFAWNWNYWICVKVDLLVYGMEGYREWLENEEGCGERRRRKEMYGGEKMGIGSWWEGRWSMAWHSAGSESSVHKVALHNYFSNLQLIHFNWGQHRKSSHAISGVFGKKVPLHAYSLISSTRHEVKPEGVSNVFLTKPVGDQRKPEGVERHPRGVKPPTPDKSLSSTAHLQRC